MRRATAVILLVVVLALPTVAGQAGVDHEVEVVVGDDVGVVEHLGDVDELRLPVPSGARVQSVTRDDRPAAWARDGDVVRADGAGNYSVTYRLSRGRIDLVRTLRHDVAEATVRIDAPSGWTVETVGLDRTGTDPFTASGANLTAGTAYGARLTPPSSLGPDARLVPFLVLLFAGLAAAGGVAVWRLRGPEPGETEMDFWDHYRELRHRLILTLVPFLVAFVAVFSLRLESVAVGGWTVLAPVPSQTGGIAAQVFDFLRGALLPASVELIVVTPVDAILAEITVGLFLALVLTSPIAAYHAARFFGPALLPTERDLVLKVVPAVTGLFLVGCLFSLVLIVPFTFEFLYAYGRALGALTFITAQEFVSFTVLLVVAFGLSFELPVVMVALGEVGVSSELWAENWRLAVVAIFVFAAFITPDGSGVTMMIVGLPLTGLYALGYGLVRRREERRPDPAGP